MFMPMRLKQQKKQSLHRQFLRLHFFFSSPNGVVAEHGIKYFTQPDLIYAILCRQS